MNYINIIPQSRTPTDFFLIFTSNRSLSVITENIAPMSFDQREIKHLPPIFAPICMESLVVPNSQHKEISAKFPNHYSIVLEANCIIFKFWARMSDKWHEPGSYRDRSTALVDATPTISDRA